MIKKIIVIGHDNYGAREIFTAIADKFVEIEIALVITTGLYYRKSAFQSILKMLKEASWLFCFNRFLEMLKYRLSGDTLFARAKDRDIEIFCTADINGEEANRFIKQFAPDLIVSTFTMHIHKEHTINLSRVASIGCHPSVLPNYRGLEVFFWQLANGETSSGTSVFYLTEKIDAGKVIMQEEFSIDPDETVASLYAKLTMVTAQLLVVAIEKFKRGEKFEIFLPVGKGAYYPMPTREAYKKFKTAGRKWG